MTSALSTPTLPFTPGAPVAPPDAAVYAAARARSDGQAKPLGALGRLEELGCWVAACQGTCPPRPLDNVRVVVFAGDHGVSAYGVSAYPAALTTSVTAAAAAGQAGVTVLAAALGVRVRVLDIGCVDDIPAVEGAGVSGAALAAYKVRRGSEPLHLRDALTAEETRAALTAGDAIAAEEIAAGAQLLIAGDIGIGNTTPAAALIAASHHLPASAVTGRGTGLDDVALAAKTELVDAALARVGDRAADPLERLAALGSADMAAAVGFLIGAARRGVPVLVDGVIAAAEATLAEGLAPGTAAWLRAGHLSPEPACAIALERLGLEPILDLGMRLGEGTGAVCAVPVVRTAVAALTHIALLADLLEPDAGPEAG